MNADYKERIKQFFQILEQGDTVFFGGAGVSTESGIPDFRSVDGLYHQQYAYPPEQIISRSFFDRDPIEFYRFYKDKMLFPFAQPNACHQGLAKLEEMGKLNAVVTQNIDGLHQKAGSKRVFELHGSVWRNYCMRCGKAFSLEEVKSWEGVPKCACGGTVKPDVVLYEEGLDDEVVTGAIEAIMRAKTLIVGGTSLVVYPAAGLLRYFKGKHLVMINQTPTPADAKADLLFTEDIGKVFADVMKYWDHKR
ncbi:MAG: NAD-dependent protein deacylase [Clostridia bacterium]|nr:NAD-dependent protein deacylase [Clostridia bacterium]